MPKIPAILVDPFQGVLYPLLVKPEAAAIAELLDCDWIQGVNIPEFGGIQHIGWVDEEGLLRQPFVYPRWTMPEVNGGHPLAGYGLITGASARGDTIGCMIPIDALSKLISFELWRTRIPIDDVIPQMMRVYDLSTLS
jgi:hypothetical protein